MSDLSDRLSGKVALITGASSGIGEATAVALAEHGVQVAIAARREERLRQLSQRIEALGSKALVFPADITDEVQVRSMVEQIKTTWGRLDICVNNAGVMQLGPIAGANTDEWRRMLDVNVLGLMLTTHAVLPLMLEQGSGEIINVSSVAGRVARAGSGVYNATKWAVCAFSEALRQEVTRKNIRVTLIEPGIVATELWDHTTHPETRARFDDLMTSMRTLKSEDIVAAILYAITQPPHVSVNEILVRPTDQER